MSEIGNVSVKFVGSSGGLKSSVTDAAKALEAFGKAATRSSDALSAGTAFEWYDFFIFGSLATIIARHFYAEVGEATAYILALLTFALPITALVLGARSRREINRSSGTLRGGAIAVAAQVLAAVVIAALCAGALFIILRGSGLCSLDICQ